MNIKRWFRVGVQIANTISKKQFVFFVMAVLGLVFIPPAFGDEVPTFEVKATAGFGKVYKSDKWTPLRIKIRNRDLLTGPVAVRVDMEAGCPSAPHGRVIRRYRTNVMLDGTQETNLVMGMRRTSAANKCWLYLIDLRTEEAGGIAPKQATSVCSTGQCPMIRPADLPKAEKILHAVSLKEVVEAAKPRYDTLKIVVNPSPELEEILSFRDLDVKTAKTADLMETACYYESLDAVVLDQMEGADLSEAHAVALRDWVVTGGALVVTRACLESAWGKILLRQFPVEVNLAQPLTTAWGNAAAFLGMEQDVVAPIELIPLELPATFQTVMGNNLPFLAKHHFTQGSLIIIPFNTSDVHSTTGKDRRLQEQLWSRIFEDVNYSRPGAYWSSRATVPDNLSVRTLVFPYLLFVIVSVLFLGPICTLLVRKRRHRIHVLWVIPTMAILLCVAAFVGAVLFRGNVSHVEAVSVLEGNANSPYGLVRTYIGVVSGDPGMYTLGAVSPETLIMENIEGSYYEAREVGLFPATVDIGNDAMAVGDLYMNRWAMRFFKVERPVVMPRLSSNLHIADDCIVGWVRNDSEVTVKQASLLFKWNRQEFGDIAPGQQVEVEFVLEEPPPTVQVYNPYYANFSMISNPLNPVHWPNIPFEMGMTQLLSNYGVLEIPTLVGFLPESIVTDVPVQLEHGVPTRNNTLMGVWRLPIDISRQEQLTSQLSVATSYGSGTLSLDVRQWTREVIFTFPGTEAEFTKPEITLFTRLTGKSLKEMTPQDEFRIRFYDWTSQSFSSEMKMEVGIMIIPDSSRFVRPGDNKVKMSIILAGPKANNYGGLTLDRIECSVSEVAS